MPSRLSPCLNQVRSLSWASARWPCSTRGAGNNPTFARKRQLAVCSVLGGIGILRWRRDKDQFRLVWTAPNQRDNLRRCKCHQLIVTHFAKTSRDCLNLPHGSYRNRQLIWRERLCAHNLAGGQRLVDDQLVIHRRW